MTKKEKKKLKKARKQRRQRVPRPYTWVKFDYDNFPAQFHADYLLDFPKSEAGTFTSPRFIFMGECPNCPGHCFLWDMEKNLLTGMWHTDNFIELNPDTEI